MKKSRKIKSILFKKNKQIKEMDIFSVMRQPEENFGYMDASCEIRINHLATLITKKRAEVRDIVASHTLRMQKLDQQNS